MKQRIKVNKPVAITEDGSLLMVEDLFSYSEGFDGKPFAGATGTEYYGVTQSEIDDRNDPDLVTETYDMDHYWREAVAGGYTSLSLEEYVEAAINEADGYFFGHDVGDAHLIPNDIKTKYYPTCETFDCVSAGRIFGRTGQVATVILDQDLWDAVQALEADPTLPLEMLADLLNIKLETDHE